MLLKLYSGLEADLFVIGGNFLFVASLEEFESRIFYSLLRGRQLIFWFSADFSSANDKVCNHLLKNNSRLYQ